MKKLTMVCSPNLLEASKLTIAQIKKTANDIFCEHFVVVPDRFSLLAENMIFDEVEVESTMNITVVGLSRLASLILEDAGQTMQTLTTEQSILVVRKVVLENMKDFCFFPKNSASLGFCEEIFKTIQQLIASKVSFNDLKTEKSGKAFQNKLHDISLIFEAYQNEICGKFVDSGEKFELFESAIKTSELVKNSRFYFCQFDSLTEQGNAIFVRLCECAKEVYAAVVTKNDKRNSYLFSTDLLEKISAMENMENCIDIITAPALQNPFSLHIQNNLLTSRPEKLDGKNFFELRSALTFEEEAFFCVRKIKELIFLNKATPSQICLTVAGLETKKQTLQKLFFENDIPFFIDSSYPLIETKLACLVLEMLDIFPNSKNILEIVSFFKSEFFDLGNLDSFENFIIKYAIKKNEMFAPFKRGDSEKDSFEIESQRKKIADYIMLIENGIKTSDSFGKKSELMKNFLLKIHAKEKLEQIFQEETNCGKLFFAKITQQTFQKIVELLSSISCLFADESVSWNDYSLILQSGMNATKISQIPISSNAVFIGDSEQSFFGECKFLFVLGATEGNYPTVKNDCGLISDREIVVLDNLKISPTIKMLNSRARFKVFGDLCHASQKIFASFSSDSEEKQVLSSSIVTSLLAIFSLDIEPLSVFSCSEDEDYSITEFYRYVKGEHKGKLSLPFFAFSKENAEKLIFKLEFINTEESLLCKKILKDYLQTTTSNKPKVDKIESATELFFANGNTSVSKTSAFLTCPRQHFFNYGLKVKEREDAKVEAKNIGSILHKIAEMFTFENSQNLGKMTNQEVENWANDALKRVLTLKEFECFVYGNENAFVLHIIKSEVVILCKCINDQQKVSLFKPTYFEKKFGSGSTFGSCQVLLPEISIDVVGTIDRIDEYEDMFRVIDYKTGDSKQSLSKLFYGTNIQLMLYASVARKALSKSFVGSFVFPISNAFNKDGTEKSNGRLVGFIASDIEIIKKMDTSLTLGNIKSKILDITLTPKLAVHGRMKTAMSVEKLKLLSDYSFKVLESAVRDIASGIITPSPIAENEAKLPCRYCFAKCICPFSQKDDEFRKYDNVEIDDFQSALDGEGQK